MKEGNVSGIPLEEIVIPSVVFPTYALFLFYILRFVHFGENKAFKFFKKIREGWIVHNHLAGQDPTMHTRDYLKILRFFATSAVLIASILGGFAIKGALSSSRNALDILITFKLIVITLAFVIIFIVYIVAIRFATYFHFIMNVYLIDRRPVTKEIMLATFEESHAFYSIGLRIFYLTIPLFAWLISPWVLLATCPIVIIIAYYFEKLQWMQNAIDKFYNQSEQSNETKEH